MVDYEASSEHNNLEINVVRMSSDYFIFPEEEMAHLQFQLVRSVEPSADSTPESVAPVSATHVDEVPLVPPGKEDEELVDYEASPERNNLEINVVHMSSDYFIFPEEEMAHLQFGPRDAVFKKPKESNNHLKVLYMRGHVNGKLISRMLVDGGAIVNLMPYSLYKKLGEKDEELIKTNMTVSGVVEVIPLVSKGLLPWS